MPYSQEELQANEHYTSIKNRDEVKYQQDFVNTKNKWLNSMEPVGSKDFDTLRTDDDTIQLYQDPETGNSMASESQFLNVKIYRTKYRTATETQDLLNREFEEF
tara:strand:+ start:30 stop:341 length:312 start_codon:yes stop_codon:yes gene_type:complete